MAARGEVIFTEGVPPQSFICCGRCNRHFMVCGCSDVGHGVDYVFKKLPDPSPNLTRMELMRRFASLVAVVPSMRAFSVMPWLQNEGPGIVAAIDERESQLRQMMDGYVASLPNSDMLAALYARCIGSQHFTGEASAVRATVIGIECHTAISTFISGDWAALTRLGVVLINNAFQVSDKSRYRLDDSHLMAIFGGGVEVLLAISEMGFSDHGYMLALECDRPPCGTNPAFQSASHRNCPIIDISARCNYCGKPGDSNSGSSLKMCSRCKIARYCSGECQKLAWKSHKKNCPK